MEIQEIVISAIVGGTIALITNNIASNLNYKKEYFKRIIDKRMQSYEMVSGFIGEIRKISVLETGQHYSMIFCTPKKFKEYMLSIHASTTASIWLSSVMSKLLGDLNLLLNNSAGQMQLNWNSDVPDNNLENVGIELLPSITLLTAKMETQLFDDMQTLHKVSDFLDEVKYVKLIR